jgi:hypothetical protein
MVIHSASDPRPRTTLCGDYFYNYFTRGLDILFDGQVFISLCSKGYLSMTLFKHLCAWKCGDNLFFFRLIESRSLFCTQTILVMQILIRT